MIVATDWLNELRCDCGGEAMAIEPGSNDLVEGPTDVLLKRGVPVRGWCLACAMRRGWLEEAA